MRDRNGQPLSSGSSAYRKLPPELNRKVGRARLVLLLERVWPALWAPLGVAGLFVLLSLFGVWSYLEFEVHRGLLWGFAAALLVSFIPLMRIEWPRRGEALRLLESRAGLPHRPASAYQDTLAADTPSAATRRLWDAHRRRLSTLFARLKAGWPHPRIDRWDPLALRVLLLLLLAVGFVIHRDDAHERIGAAFDLNPPSLASLGRIDAWITPPVYTARQPVIIADGARQYGPDEKPQTHFEVPENSELTIRVNHQNAAKFLLRMVTEAGKNVETPLDQGDGTEADRASLAPGKSGEGTAEFNETLAESGAIELLEDGSPVARWTVAVIKDQPPTITMSEAPNEAERGSLKFKYHVEDDYGVSSAMAQIGHAGGSSWDENDGRPARVQRLGQAPSIPLTLPRANTQKGSGQTYRDLTSHFWAGLPVIVTLEARDQAGQTGYSDPYKVILPARQFHKPLARAVIEQRKKLVDRPDLKDKVARAMDALTIAPEKFITDVSIYLAMRSAYWGLMNASGRDDLETSANLLWEIATRIEDGDLTDAERRLRMAQEKLMRALEDGASDEEIRQLMNELRTALNEFLDAMRQQAQQSPNFDPDRDLAQGRVMTSQDLERMLNQIEDLARSGSKDAARQMLSQLRDMLENLQRAQPGQNQQAQQMMQALDDLSGIIQEQQKLLDETFRAQQQGENGQQMPGQQGQGQQPGQQQGQGQQGQRSFGQLQQGQGDLQRQLQELMNQLRGMGAQPPEQFGGAGEAMGNAGEALGQENAGQATEQQTLALDRLHQGAQSLAEQMMQGMGQPGPMGRAFNGNGDRDPLGRPLPTQGLDDGDSVKVPEESEVQRARQILEELRRRLGQRGRPQMELDYIERLIERF
ncbi:MAG TPA: TIGR02302 family protein [Hyphomicrobiales bacterium]|nr:TIGR02302 family protein [Hyphomicrobiales bacterium]